MRARLTLPLDVSLAADSLRGPWQYDAAERTLIWAGKLSPDTPSSGAALTLGADLDVTAGVPAGSLMLLRAQLYAGNGLTVTADAPVAIDVPWLTISEQASPAQITAGTTARYTITVQNIGLLTTTAHLTDTLPAEMKLVADSLWASRGAVTAHNERLHWSAVLEPGAQAQLGFSEMVVTIPPSARLADWAELTDDRGRRLASWAAVVGPKPRYLPLILR